MAGEREELPSPKNKVKFLCSHGGKILPRPTDGQLKYVGGETRVIAVHHHITFSELMKKLNAQFNGEMILKYQLVPDELDVLVSVKTDEDLKHMFREYDRQENEGSPRLRTFLFPAKPIVLENQPTPTELHGIEQRYIDAVNGIIRSPRSQSPPINAYYPTSSFSSACSSPNSPSRALESIHENGRVTMQRVKSSPSLCGLDSLQKHGIHHVHQHYYHHNNHNHHPHHQNHNHYYNHLSSKPPLDPHKIIGAETTSPISSPNSSPMGMSEMLRSRSHSSSRYYRGSGTCNKCGYCDEYPIYGT